MRRKMFVVACLVSILSACVVTDVATGIDRHTVPNMSMEPAIPAGAVVRSDPDVAWEIGDIVLFDTPANQPSNADLQVKRVIAGPGALIEFVDAGVIVDGAVLDETYLAPFTETRTRTIPMPGCDGEAAVDRCLVPDDHVFVMGDNRTGSSDSRTFGPIPTSSIQSVVVEVID